jgi:hypothetical protein
MNYLMGAGRGMANMGEMKRNWSRRWRVGAAELGLKIVSPARWRMLRPLAGFFILRQALDND